MTASLLMSKEFSNAALVMYTVLLSTYILKRANQTMIYQGGRSKSLNLRGHGVWIGGVNSSQDLAYQTQGPETTLGLQGKKSVPRIFSLSLFSPNQCDDL